MQHDTMQTPTGPKAKYEYTAIDYVIFVAMILICLWSWIFVEPDTLQRSAAAQMVVKIVTSVIPWVAALERYGPQAHQLLLVHSVCYAVLLPMIATSIAFKKPQIKSIQNAVFAIGIGLALIAFFGSIYFNLSSTFLQTARRGGFGLLIYDWSMPMVACLLVVLLSIFVIFVAWACVYILSMIRNNHD